MGWRLGRNAKGNGKMPLSPSVDGFFQPCAKRRPLEGTYYVFDFDEQQRNGGLADAERHQQEHGPDPK